MDVAAQVRRDARGRLRRHHRRARTTSSSRPSARTTRASCASSPSACARSTASARPRRSCTSGWSSSRTSGAPARPTARCRPPAAGAGGARRHPNVRRAPRRPCDEYGRARVRPATMRPVRDGRPARLTRSERAGRPGPVQTLILLAVVANLVGDGRVVIPPLLGRRGPLQPGRRAATRSSARPPSSPPCSATPPGRARRPGRSRPAPTTGSSGSCRWVFILATLDDRRGDRALARDPAGDLRPPRRGRAVRPRRPRPAAAGALGTAKFVLEGSVAITFATLLVVLTGARGRARSSSPSR